MFSVKVIESFSGAHFLKEYKGKCEQLHGHNWKVEVEVFSPVLSKEGMVMDFTRLKKILRGVLDKYDHTLLNKVKSLKGKNPTSENIAAILFREIKPGIKKYKHIEKMRVCVWEQERSCAVFEGTVK